MARTKTIFSNNTNQAEQHFYLFVSYINQMISPGRVKLKFEYMQT